MLGCENLLNTCVLALAGSFGAVVAATVALVKAKAAHARLDMREEEKKEDEAV